MKLVTLALLGIGAVVAWPHLKDAAAEKLVNHYLKESGLSEDVRKAGPLAKMMFGSLGTAAVENELSTHDIGTQIEVVFSVLVLNEMPTFK